jgi:anti-sigma B factor antagonist
MAEFQQLEVSEIDEVTVVRFRAKRFIELAEIEKLGHELYKLVEEKKCDRLVIDFSGVDLFSSAGFGKLISVHAKMKANKGVLKLCNISEHIRDVFHICKLDRIFEIHEDEADALSGFSV